MSKFTDSAESRETSIEVMAAIEWLASNESESVAIWEAPTEEQILAIWERVTKNGLIEDDLYWGGSSEWAGK